MPGIGEPRDEARHRQLLALKLATLVREHRGEGPVEPATWPGGAALVRDGEAWVLADSDPHRALGPAMAWAYKSGATSVNVIAERATGVLSRRATLFREPPAIWRVEQRRLLPAHPEPYPPPTTIPVDHEPFVSMIAAAGATPHREHGVLTGEVAGLEVCRVLTDEFTGLARMEVGVGVHDREAFQMMHGDVPTETSLARVVAAVAEFRSPGADPHPLNRLRPERLLRARLMAEPELVGANSVQPVDPPVVRRNLKDAAPCVALASGADGRSLLVVCSVGVDLDLVPFAADARAFTGEDRLVLVMPKRDAVPITLVLARALRSPALVVTVELSG